MLVSLWLVGAPLAAACSTSIEPGGGGSSLGDGGLGGQGGSCPCEVGNDGIRFTIGCGQSQCITLNGQTSGVRCTEQGAVDDPSACTDPPPPPPDVDAGPCGRACTPPETCGGGGVENFCGCTPTSCEDLNACGSTRNDCNVQVDCPACSGGSFCSEGGKCLAPARHVMVVGNREGGSFAINVDRDLPGLAIALVSREPMHVTIAGAYASQVVGVVHAGYAPGSSVDGVPATLFSDLIMPSVDPDGGFGTTISDGSPSAANPSNAEIAAYFLRYFGGEAQLLSHQCQREAYTSTLLVSAPGTCTDPWAP